MVNSQDLHTAELPYPVLSCLLSEDSVREKEAAAGTIF